MQAVSNIGMQSKGAYVLKFNRWEGAGQRVWGWGVCVGGRR